MRKPEKEAKRQAENAMRDRDVDLVLAHGTPTNDGVLLQRSDILNAMEQMKDDIRRLEQLCGSLVVNEGRWVTTVRRAREWKRRVMPRRLPIAVPGFGNGAGIGRGQ